MRRPTGIQEVVASILMSGHILLAYQIRFSMIFTSADKSYLTYTYPTRGIDKNRITARFVNTLVV